MRWAEAHSHNIRKMFVRLMFGKWESSSTVIPNSFRDLDSSRTEMLKQVQHDKEKKRVWKQSPLTLPEKLEFLYLSPYYLQAAFFILGTLSWFIAEVVFKVRLPFWTEVWGWSLVFTNLLALPLLNMVGLFLEESDEKDYLGLFSFITLSYIVAPFQGYAAIKGFISKEEGPWFRTPKTGRITDTFTPGRLYRFVQGIFGGRAAPTLNTTNRSRIATNVFALVSSHNTFQNFRVRRKTVRWVGNASMALLLIVTIFLTNFANTLQFSSSAYAAKPEVKTVRQSESKNTNKDQLERSEEVRAKKEPKNKKTIIRNGLSKEITGYSSVAKKTKNGETVEFIFHQSPKVRIKLGAREIEFETNRIGGKFVNPKKTKIYQDKEVVYEDVVKDIDLRYTINGDLITEEFIIKNHIAANAIGSTIEQTVRTVDVKVISPDDPSAFGFYTEDGTEIFKLSRPFIKDAENKITNDVSITLKKTSTGHKLTKTLGLSTKEWLQDQTRAYPVSLDPSVIISGTATDADVQYGGLQRKVAFVNSKWYAFHADGGIVSYQDSTDGVSWDAATTISADSSDTDNHNPSIAVSNGFIHVFWVDDGDNEPQARRLDTSSDTLGTECVSLTASANISSTYMVSVAELSDTIAVVAFSDTTGGSAGVGVYRVTALDGTCAMTDIHPGNIVFGTAGAGLTDGDRPVIVSLSSTSVAVIFQDGDLSYSLYDDNLTEWRSNNQQIVNDNDTVYSVTTDGTTIWVLMQNGTASADLFSLNTSSTDVAETQIDADAGTTNDDGDSDIDMYCTASTDCKVVYTDCIDAAAGCGSQPSLVFRDCDDEDCSTGTSTVLDADIGAANDQAGASVYCVSATNCKVAYGDDLNTTTPALKMIDCGDDECSSPAVSNELENDLGGNTTILHTSISCPSDTNCKILYNQFTASDVKFVDCPDATCTGTSTSGTCTSGDRVCTQIDGTSGSTAKVDLYCVASDNCKLVYHDNSATGGCADANSLCFVDCTSDEDCSTNGKTVIDSDIGSTTGASPVSIDCIGGDTECRVVYGDGTDGDLTFVDCNASATCASATLTDIDVTGGATTSTFYKVAMSCIVTTILCKIIYVGETTSGSEDAYFAACTNDACTAGSVFDLDGPRFAGTIWCPATDNCKMSYYDGTTAADPTVQFADCDTADCLVAWTNASDPWTGQGSNLETVSITYDSSNSDLYAHAITDATNQAYWNKSDAASIAWDGQVSYGWTAADMTQLSAPEVGAGTTAVGVVVRLTGTSNYEFAPIPEYNLVLLAILPFMPRIFRKLRKKQAILIVINR